MRRRFFTLAALSCLALVAAQVRTLSPDHREATIRYLLDRQCRDGGFGPTVGGDSDLPTTSAVLRALKYLGGVPREKAGPGKFIERCYDRAQGGFAPTPGGKVDVRTTSLGLMALVEAKLPIEDRADAIQRYLAAQVKSPDDVYIAIAGLAAANLKPASAEAWRLIALAKNSNEDAGRDAFDLAGEAIMRLRLGDKVAQRDLLFAKLVAAQQADGGFHRAGKASDLSTTYRIVRALAMLEGKADPGRLRGFVAKCRNEDGGYGPAAGQPSNPSSTYFAAILLHWSEGMDGK